MTTPAAALQDHLLSPRGRGALADAPHSGAAGGAACGDLVRIAVRVEGERVAGAGFEAAGCAAVRAAASAVVELAEGEPLLEAATLDAEAVSEALGGLAPGARHGADLAVDALHRAIGSAARAGAPRLPRSGRRTLVAMSGGVDSAVAAWLALEAGHEVVGVTLELWSDPGTDGERSCCSPNAVIAARRLAHSIGVPHFTLDLRERFRAQVVEDFIAGYAGGRTPNPCVRCNGFVRFDAMLALADCLGAERLATGHYARIDREPEGPLVRAGEDPAKDQSYMLARLPAEQLERLWFPLGERRKPEVRELARRAGLPVADKRESQDLCFLAGAGRRAFLRRHGGPALGERLGELVDARDRVLGRHPGQHHFTVGQRRGIGVSSAEPLYVLERDAARNRVVVGPRSQLRASRVALDDVHLHRPASAAERVKLRYRSHAVGCRLVEDLPAGRHPRAELVLERPLEAVAPGQLACLLNGDRVVGAGTIVAAETEAV